MSSMDLKSLLEAKESANLEFKESKTGIDQNTLLKYCVAIANEGGGHLVLGVSDKLPRIVVGTEAINNPAKMSEKVLNSLNFRVDITEHDVGDKRVVLLQIPSRNVGTAYQYKGAYWMRAGESLVPMTPDKLRAVFNEGHPDWIDRTAKDKCSSQEVTRLLNVGQYFSLTNQPIPSTTEESLEQLERNYLVSRSGSNWSITNLGAILLATDLREFGDLEFKAPRLVVYTDSSKVNSIQDRIEYQGYAMSFPKMLDIVIALAPTNEVIQKAIRKDIPMYPPVAVRELLANAFIHQDLHESGSRIMIELYTDRLSITNPGTPKLQPERFIDSEIARNERLADLMRRMNLCERKGSGVDRALAAIEAQQLPAIDIKTSSYTTSVTVFSHRPIKSMTKEDRIRACYQHCALRHVMNKSTTNSSLRDRFGLPQSKSELVSRVIRDTVEAEYIKPKSQSASKKYSKYVPFWA